MRPVPEETSVSIALLALGVTMILLVATIAGETMRARASGPNPALDAYNARVSSWWAMMLLISLALISGPTGVILLFAFASFAALREFLTLTTKRKADHWALVASFYVVFPLQYLFVWLEATKLFTSLVPVYAFLILPILSALRGDGTRFLRRVSETQWGLMICVYCLSHIPALLTLDTGDDRAVLLIAFLVLVVQFGDLAEYYFGRIFGKRQIAPEIAPITRGGVAFGLLAAMAVGSFLWWTTPFALWVAALVAAATYLMGVGGKLVLAAIKTDRGVKNWGHLIPGQGGFVDQMDSVVFAAPVLFHLSAALLGT